MPEDNYPMTVYGVLDSALAYGQPVSLILKGGNQVGMGTPSFDDQHVWTTHKSGDLQVIVKASKVIGVVILPNW